MSAYDDLIEALEAELHDHRWWKTPGKTKPKKRGKVPAVSVLIEDELTTARRREELDKEWSAFHKRHRAGLLGQCGCPEHRQDGG